MDQRPSEPGDRRATDDPESYFRLLVETVRDYAIFGLDPAGGRYERRRASAGR